MIMSLDQAVGEIMTAFDGMNNDNIRTQYGSNPDNNFQFGSEDQGNQEQSKWDGPFSGNEPAQKAVQGEARTHNFAEDQGNQEQSKWDGPFSGNEPAQKAVQGEARTHNFAEDHENSEDIGSHEDIKDSDDIQVSADLEGLEGLEDTEDYENIKGHKKKNADQKVDKNLENNGNHSDKAEVINNTPEEVNSVENNDRVQGHLGDLKTLEIQIEQQIDGKNTIPEFGHKIDKESHLKNNQEPRPLPEARLVRRDSSETEALYKEAATKQDIVNAFSSSPKVDQSNLASTQAASKVVSPTPTPSTSKKTSGLGWSTWGLSIITLGICFAFFAAICTVVERRGHFLG
jgi:hypothetical protein